MLKDLESYAGDTSKGHTKPNMAELKPYYDDLFAEFFPEKLDW